MAKFLLISGSPRQGNTEFILKKIFKALPEEKELILLRKLNINRCKGCLGCDKSKKCVQQDDMQAIYSKMQSADFLIIGSPNYFDNVSGLLKDFIDRTVPLFYEGEANALKGKKAFFVVVGGGEVENSQPVVEILQDFAQIHGIKTIGSHCFKAQNANDAAKDPETLEEIKKIIKEMTSSSP
ncbi:MAG: flavodoxin family protein [Patescibacteria group bacterium]